MMNVNLDSVYDTNKKKKLLILFAFALSCSIMTITSDYWESKFQGTSFYFSESFLFSLFWLLLLPLLHLQSVLSSKFNSGKWIIILFLLPLALHLFTFPALIWFLSKLLYNHTFSYGQTLQFGIPEYFLKLSLVYSFSLLLFQLLKNKFQTLEYSTSEKINSIIVADGIKKTNIETKDILFFIANSPYITIHHPTKKYLHTTTLKSLSNQLNSDFVRIHKSTIINVKQVDFYTSRLNGDYDVTMRNGCKLRISRTFATHFKLQFEKCHQHTLV